MFSPGSGCGSVETCRECGASLAGGREHIRAEAECAEPEVWHLSN